MQVDSFSALRDRLVVPADDADQTYIVANLEGTGFQPEGLDPFERDALEMLMDDDPYEGVVEEALANQEDWQAEREARALCFVLNGPHDHDKVC